ncbi:MAG: metal ABC transporter permease [Thermoguttaceae bacterium]|jgi:manganese/zinc/iron transport system permease protein|nr:metal ABC transporter permease [Thermoguttaceae bacterium]
MAWLQSLSPDTETTLWVMLIGAMTNTACALLGCYLVLRRMSLLGDAISHAVLPGLVVAFILSGTLNVGYMFLGALAVGLLTSALTETLHRHGGVAEDAAMGVVFTSLFALGVILIKRYGSGVDLDPGCVLEGLLEFVDLNRVEVAGHSVPRALVSIAPVLALNLLFLVVFWKELLVSSFDPALATTMGFRAGLLHYVLMALVALTTVASFEQVGSILVIAMLIVPGATAHLLTDRLRTMLGLAAAIAVASAVLGQLAATRWNTNTAGMMSVVAGMFYLAAVCFSPRYGMLSVLVGNFRNALTIVREDLLAMLYRLEELAAERPLGPREAIQAVGGGVLATLGLWSLARRGEIQRDHSAVRLTERGRRRASQIVRSHRLWEAYLVRYLGLPLDHVHEPAAHMEHYIGGRLQEQLAADLEQTGTDPHGRQIPHGEPPPASGTAE